MRELTTSAKLMEIMNCRDNLLPITVESLPSEREKFELLKDVITRLMSVIAESHDQNHSLNPKDYMFSDFNIAYEFAKASGEKKNILFFMTNIYSDITAQKKLDEERLTLHLITLDSIKINNLMSLEMKSTLGTTITVTSKDDAKGKTYNIFDTNIKTTVIYSFLIFFLITELMRVVATAVTNTVNGTMN